MAVRIPHLSRAWASCAVHLNGMTFQVDFKGPRIIMCMQDGIRKSSQYSNPRPSTSLSEPKETEKHQHGGRIFRAQ